MTWPARQDTAAPAGVRRGRAGAAAGGVHISGAALVAVLALGGLAFSLLQSMIAPALPVIGHDLRASPGSTGWLVTGYLLAAAVATPIAGRMGDLWGRRRLLIAVLGILAAGCAIDALARSLAVLVAGRFVQGAAGAVFPLAFGILRDTLAPHRVSTAVGLLSATLGIGGGAGIVLAGPITVHLGWHWIFWLALAVTGIALAGTVALVPESARRAGSGLSLPAVLLLTGWLVCLLLAVSNGAGWGWTSPGTLALLTVTAVAAAGWVAVEVRSRQPLVDLRLLARRPVWAADASALAFGFGMFGSFLLVPGLLEAPAWTGYGFGQSATTAGLFLLPGSIMLLLFGPVSGVLTRRAGARAPIVAGGLVCCVSFALPAIDHSHRWQVLACATGSGIGLGLAYAALPNAIIAHVAPEQTGAATGVNTLARSVGSSVGAAAVAAILAAYVTRAGVPGNVGFTAGFGACAAMFGVGGAAALLIGRTAAGQQAHGTAGAAAGSPPCFAGKEECRAHE
jgi:MFS family permease